VTTAAPATLAARFVQEPGAISALARLPDGSRIVGGVFERAGGATRRNLFRVAPDGAFDAGWAVDANGTVRALAYANSSIYVGGAFTTLGGVTRAGLGRVSDTTPPVVDASWNPATAAEIRAIVPSGAQVYVGGSFTAIGGLTRHAVARLSGTGTGVADATWNANVAAGGFVYTLALAPGGPLYLGGVFTTIGGAAREYIARVGSASGAVDVAWNPTPSNLVIAIDADASGSTYIGGWFESVSGIGTGRLARLLPNGTVDTTWSSGISLANVNALARAPDGSVFAGGAFTFAGGLARNRVAKLSPVGGAADPGWNPNVGAANTTVDALVLGSDGVLTLGGTFTSVGVQGRQQLAAVPSVVDPIFANGFE
jgi:hypothetical protein